MSALNSMSFDYINTFKRYVRLQKCIGLDYFNESHNCFLRKYAKLIVFNITFLPFICGQFFLISKIDAGNFLEGAQIVPVAVMFGLDVIKMTIAVMKRSQIRDMFIEIGELWPKELEFGEERAIVLKKWSQRMGVILNSYFIFAIANMILFEAMPLLTTSYNIYSGVHEYIFPFRLCGLWEVNSNVSFVVTYIWELISTVPCQLCLYVPFDLMIVTLTSNISVLLRLLQVDIENAVKSQSQHQSMRMRCNTASKNYENIQAIVVTHQKLLRVANKLNDIFGLVIFIHVAFSAVVICFFGFLTVIRGGLAESIADLLAVFYSIVTIFLLALAGQLLCDTSANVASAAYRSLWYESDIKLRKLIFFVIIRSQRPSYLSAMGYSYMNLRSFSKIMSTAWTYFSLLIQVYEDN